MLYIIDIVSIIIFLCDFAKGKRADISITEIKKWRYGKKGALSLTYDYGSINQFGEALLTSRTTA